MQCMQRNEMQFNPLFILNGNLQIYHISNEEDALSYANFNFKLLNY